jgi:hypothetical protein
MTSYRALCWALLLVIPATAPAFAAQKKPAAKKAPPGRTETLACRLGTEDRHARIAIVVIKGKTDSFAYYSKWKPRTCSIYLQRNRDYFSKWADNGAITTVSLEKGAFLIEHKPGEYHFIFRDVDRERYCGMDGVINGSLTIKRGNEKCILEGDIMVEGAPLGEAVQASVKEDPQAASAPPPDAAPAAPTALSVTPEPAAVSLPPAVSTVSAPPAAPSASAASASAPAASAPAAGPTASVPTAAPTASAPAQSATSIAPPETSSASVKPSDAPAASEQAPKVATDAAPPTSGGTTSSSGQQSCCGPSGSPSPPAVARAADDKADSSAPTNPFSAFFRSLNKTRPDEQTP